jgi:ABC-type nickel/cobalt efflux system permease component RcnA
LPTTRIELLLTAPLPAQDTAWELTYADSNFADRIGWKEVVVNAPDGIVLLESSAPTEDITNGLRSYPEEIMLDNTTATIRFEPLGLSGATESVVVPAVENGGGGISITNSETDDRFANLINTQLENPGVIAGVVIYALFAGAAHALTPGHGKTIVAAYLVGSRGTTAHALFLGLTTTVTHTLGVFGVGLITLFASRFILPEQLFPWIGVFSGLLVIAIGWSLFRGRLAGVTLPEGEAGHDHGEVEFVDGNFVHAHGGGAAHTHLPPTSAGGISWGSLFALGVSGGLLPCPSALVLMLAAISLQRIGLGLVLILIFSIGLAGVLTAIGIMWVKARDMVNRFSGDGGFMSRIPYGEQMIRFAPAASAAFITVAGIVITWRALIETGVI